MILAPGVCDAPSPSPCDATATSCIESADARLCVVPRAVIAGNRPPGRRLGHPAPATALFPLTPSTVNVLVFGRAPKFENCPGSPRLAGVKRTPGASDSQPVTEVSFLGNPRKSSGRIVTAWIPMELESCGPSDTVTDSRRPWGL